MSEAHILERELSRIAARVLHVSNSGFAYQKVKVRLGSLVEAFGIPRVTEDFESWCATSEAQAAKWPGFAYLKVVDARLRPIFRLCGRNRTAHVRILQTYSTEIFKNGVKPEEIAT